MGAKTSQPQCGADILVQCLLHHGVDTVFAYPGGASMPIHQALTRFSSRLRTILPRHEQGGGFAAEGYARSTGRVGVCVATSGPGATNLVTCLADAKMDSVPIVAITGQVSTSVIGTDAFQETPIVEVCRAITKHHYLVTRTEDIARVFKEAFHIASTGRPGPVLVDVHDLAVLGKLAQLSGNPVVEADAQGQEEVRLVDGVIGVDGAVHAEHLQAQEVVAGETAQSQQGQGHGDPRTIDKSAEVLGSARGDDAAAGIDDRPPAFADHGEQGLELVARGQPFRAVTGEVHGRIVVGNGHAVLHVLGHVEDRKSVV